MGLLAIAACLAMQTIDYREAGIRLLDKIHAGYTRHGKLCEWVDGAGVQSKDPAFTWDLAVYLSALAQAMQHDAKRYGPEFKHVFESMEPYGERVLGGFGYSDLPNLKKSDRYYDDNEWLGIALLEAYKADPQPAYLKRVEEIYAWIVSAETAELGGGLFWRENARTEKNTCSNAPAAVMAFKLYAATNDEKYLRFGVRALKWCSKLQDSDGLFLDHKSLDGKIERTKWTYNSALPIRANAELYRLTKRREYLDEAKRIGHASIAHWVDPATGAIKDEASFAHHLADAWLDLASVDPAGPWSAAAIRAIDFAYHASSGGLFGSRWDSTGDPMGQRKLIFQASMARALWHAARKA
jgi:hypothetical protein